MRGSRLDLWQALLLVAIALVATGNSIISPHFLNFANLSDSTFNFSEKAMIVLPMALLIICREIDLSVAATMALSATIMGVLAQWGVSTPLLVVAAVLVGMTAGLLNGILVTRLHVASIVATIGTMSLYRGLSYVILGDTVITGYPADLAVLGRGYWFGIPIEFWIFLILAALFGVVLHRTVFGRQLLAMGKSPEAARFSAIPVDNYKLVLFCLTGALAGLAAAFLTSRLGSTRPNLALGWELDVITMVVLGGTKIEGGHGTILGLVLAVLLLGLLNFGLQLVNVPGIVLSVVVGALLLIVIAVPRMAELLVTGRRAS